MFSLTRARTDNPPRSGLVPKSTGVANRRGATLVETAIVLAVFLLLILGTVDLGLAVFRYNVLSEAARTGARVASVHGALAPAAMGTWGPATYSGTASDGSAYAQAVAPLLAGFTLSRVNIQVEWIDGGNALQQRVRYTVSTTYRPIAVAFFTRSSYVHTASSTMRISH
ncbi:MAG: pilus assembly protein [Planctomycetes bacterium]|nr:pilus assembly protein [Planctomycetota bacterium]